MRIQEEWNRLHDDVERLESECKAKDAALARLTEENDRLKEKASRSHIQKDRDYWFNQAMATLRGNFTQCCSYCGFEAPPPNGWEELQGHIKVCPEHPLRQADADLAALKQENERLNKKCNDCDVVVLQAETIRKQATDLTAARKVIEGVREAVESNFEHSSTLRGVIKNILSPKESR